MGSSLIDAPGVPAVPAGTPPLHHREPSDLMLLAQAVSEGLTLVSHDRRLEPCGALGVTE